MRCSLNHNVSLYNAKSSQFGCIRQVACKSRSAFGLCHSASHCERWVTTLNFLFQLAYESKRIESSFQFLNEHIACIYLLFCSQLPNG
jgi:hypothetical protein